MFDPSNVIYTRDPVIGTQRLLQSFLEGSIIVMIRASSNCMQLSWPCKASQFRSGAVAMPISKEIPIRVLKTDSIKRLVGNGLPLLPLICRSTVVQCRGKKVLQSATKHKILLVVSPRYVLSIPKSIPYISTRLLSSLKLVIPVSLHVRQAACSNSACEHL